MSDSNRYANERFASTKPHCTALFIRFDGAALILSGGRESHRYPAVSGRRINGGFNYSKAAQKEPSNGPIPEGTYWISPIERWDNAFYKRASKAAWGNHRITIHPFPTTETYNRGGFFIHGGSTPGSAGCIDLFTHMDAFIEDLEKEMANTPTDCQIHVKVEYTK